MFVQSALNVLEIVMEEWRIHINKICCEKFLLNKKISTFFEEKSKIIYAGNFEISEEIQYVFEPINFWMRIKIHTLRS